MKRYLLLVKSLALSTLRNSQVLFWNLLFPVVLLVIYNIIFGGVQVDGVNYMTWILPGVVVLNILSFGLTGSAAAMLDMREKGVLWRLKATPVPPIILFTAYLTVNTLLCLTQTFILILAGALFFRVSYSATGLALAVPMVLVAVLSFTAFGQVISSLAPKMGIALAVSQLLYFAQMFSTDLIMPLSMMPNWLQQAAPWLPAYPVGQLVRAPLVTSALSPNLALNLAVVSAYAIAAALIASRFFRWEPKA